ncbi:MAG: trypsin-like peptidase domain-containing protein, partial [Pirellulales bacterium]|nr:trypsin-like peptidase domain-containing protein [Pirellulales bacterium]
GGTAEQMIRLWLMVFLLFPIPGLPALAEVRLGGEVEKAEKQRIEILGRAAEAAVAVFSAQGQGGGSGVVISPDGYALSNFHVTASCGAAMKCGMSDGKVYDAVIVGIDPVGDVALIQLLGREDFPTAELGDSDSVKVGDWAFVVGNPFLLADDFTPSVSYGMISGVRRYQYPAGTLLEYADCLQTDAAINPGNSGGPLFDAHGKLIGINGRGSFEKRGRVNVGVGYAISINQIKRFLSHLKSGRIVDHATLGATVATEEDGRVVVNDILQSSDAYRRGLRYGDQLVHFADREIANANRLKNALGIFPAGWTVPISFRREGETFDTFVRLMSLHDPSQLYDLVQQPIEPPQGEPPEEEEQQPRKPIFPQFARKKPKLPEEVAQRYVERRGYANYWYNLQRQQQLWESYQAQGGMASAGYRWNIRGSIGGGSEFHLQMFSDEATLRTAQGQFAADFVEDLERQLSPPRSGGLLLAIHLWQRMLDKGLRQYGEVYYLGQLPSGPGGEMVDCLVGIYAGTEMHFQFSPASGELVGLNMFPDEQSDPCRVQFSDYGEIAGHRVPRRWRLQFAEEEPVDYRIEQWEFGNE